MSADPGPRNALRVFFLQLYSFISLYTMRYIQMWTNAQVDAIIVDQISSNSAQQFLSGFCDSFRFQKNLGLQFASLTSVCRVPFPAVEQLEFVKLFRSISSPCPRSATASMSIQSCVHQQQLVQPCLSEDGFTRGQSAVGVTQPRDLLAGRVSPGLGARRRKTQ